MYFKLKNKNMLLLGIGEIDMIYIVPDRNDYYLPFFFVLSTDPDNSGRKGRNDRERLVSI